LTHKTPAGFSPLAFPQRAAELSWALLQERAGSLSIHPFVFCTNAANFSE